tara:strand:+ start:319 stop:594 length:276 start_codon:yes stop_codon:yes gene_type:complete
MGGYYRIYKLATGIFAASDDVQPLPRTAANTDESPFTTSDDSVTFASSTNNDWFTPPPPRKRNRRKRAPKPRTRTSSYRRAKRAIDLDGES